MKMHKYVVSLRRGSLQTIGKAFLGTLCVGSQSPLSLRAPKHKVSRAAQKHTYSTHMVVSQNEGTPI